jgi:acyl carrier protein
VGLEYNELNDVRRRVLTVVSQQLQVPTRALSDRSGLGVTEDWDSLRHLLIVTALEEDFGVRFGRTDLLAVSDVAALVRAVQASRAPSPPEREGA